MNQDAQEHTPQQIQNIDWSAVHIEPGPAIVNELDRELPNEWQQIETTTAQEITIDEDIHHITQLSDSALGELVRASVEELALDIQVVMEELPFVPQEKHIDLDIDLER